MEVSDSTSQFLHKKLPIDADEKILAIYRHHWFAYVTPFFITAILVIAILGLAALLTADQASPAYTYKGAIMAGAAFFCLLIALGGLLPAYLRSQEQLVLTEEALLQMLQPTLFSSKVDQLSLQHITDVSVHQDFFGTMLGFGQVTIETPGEQNNYKFFAIPKPHDAARAISAANENFDAALQGGRLHSTLGVALPQSPQIDPQQYQEFLQYQEMKRMQQQGTNPQNPNNNQQPNNSNQPPQNQ